MVVVVFVTVVVVVGRAVVGPTVMVVGLSFGATVSAVAVVVVGR